MSSRNVIGVVGDGRLAAKANEFDAEKYIKLCQERLKNDKNYKQRDYDMDVARCKALKMLPNHMANKQSNDKCDDNDFILTTNEFDDDIFNGFDDFNTNHNGNNYGNAERFSHSPSLSMMNVATPDSRTSFFLY